MAVLRIAKPNGNAETDDEKALVMTSERACVIEMFSGIGHITTDVDGNGTFEFTHNLGYVPAFLAFEKGYLDTTYWYDTYVIAFSADTIKFYAKAIYLDPNTTYDIFYSIAGNRNDNAVGSGNNNVSGRLRIAKDGYNPMTETDVRNMKFMSGKNVWKVDPILSGSVTQEINGGYPDPTIITIPHNLGYVPMALVLWYGGGKMLPYTVPLYGAPFMIYRLDSTNLYLEVRSAEFPIEETFKYKIFRDRIQ